MRWPECPAAPCQTSLADRRSGAIPVKNGSRSANSPPPVRNRLPARIFTVDIPSRRRKIQAVRFSNSASLFVPVLRWERKKPA